MGRGLASISVRATQGTREKPGRVGAPLGRHAIDSVGWLTLEVAHQASHSALGEWHVEDGRRVGWSVFGFGARVGRARDTRRNKQMAEGAEVPPHFFGPSPARGLPKRSVDSTRNSLVILLKKNYLASQEALATGYLQTR